MKFTSGPLFATLALTAYLPSILAVDGFAASRGSVAMFRRELANNGTAAANGTEVDAGQAENNEENAEENVDENADEEEAVDDQGNAEEENVDDQENVDEENQDENNDENLEENLEDVENLDDVNIDENNVEGSLQENIGEIMLSLGICNFNIGSLSGIGINNQIQLLLQLQQLQQLQALGIVNSFSIEQLIQQELLLNNFNLSKFLLCKSPKQDHFANII